MKQRDILDKEVVANSDKVIVILSHNNPDWLGEQGYLAKVGKLKKAKVKGETGEKIDLLDKMLSSIVELLEEKGTITKRNMKVE